MAICNTDNDQHLSAGGGVEYISPAREQYERLRRRVEAAELAVGSIKNVANFDEHATHLVGETMMNGRADEAADFAVAALGEPGPQPEVAKKVAHEMSIGQLSDALVAAEAHGHAGIDEVVDELISSVRSEAAGNYCSVWIDKYVTTDPLRINPAAFKPGVLPAEVADEVVVTLVERADQVSTGVIQSDALDDIARLPVKLSNDAAVALFRKGRYDFVLNNAHMFPQMKIDSLATNSY